LQRKGGKPPDALPPGLTSEKRRDWGDVATADNGAARLRTTRTNLQTSDVLVLSV